MGNRNPVRADLEAEALRRKRRAAAFEMRCNGGTVARIAEELHISVGQAHADIRQGSVEYGKESAEEHKAKANARFDQQLYTLRLAEATLRPIANGRRSKDDPNEWSVAPDIEAQSVLTSNLRAQAYIVKEQARMNGSYAPEKVEHTGASGGPIAVTLDDVLSTIRANEAGDDAERDRRGATTH